ncbi:ABC transporter permease [Cytophagaceae bacterium YF14B1]|uniref:ABC transporter permease n=1 Tax=Xanthocytophaga flava TaxID=3048013 RepID=A0AAE3QS69_9BACT|nr:ABC transporter permease [Xanthocytophaga flavus]MDJ1482246.1 ABC transporter permease [Xanthocytophaga flavus]
MLYNYIITTFRNLSKNVVYSFLTIFGLAVGLTAGLMMLLWVQDELSIDSFHKNTPDIYLIAANFKIDGKTQTWGNSPAPIASFGKREIPEISDAIRTTRIWNTTLFRFQEKVSTEHNGIYVDPGFFNVFDFPLIKGNAKNPFPNNRSIIITEKIAEKYFGADDPMGKIIQVNDKDNYVVSGVINNIPATASQSFRGEWFMPFIVVDERYDRKYEPNGMEGDWGNYNYITWFYLKSGSSPEKVAQKLTKIHQKNQPNAFTSNMHYSFLPLSKFHLYNADGTEAGIQSVRIFTIVAIVILLIACINYINLSTARATKRAKEVAVRKVIGANTIQLFRQFLGESAMIFVIALFLALVFIFLLMPVYNQIADKQMTFNLFNPTILLILGVTFAATLFVAGIYPSILLSSFQPLQIMKGKFSVGGNNAAFRKILVTIQFTLSITMIIGTIIVGSQLSYIQNKELGYNKENILQFSLRGEMYKHLDAIKTQLNKEPEIKKVGFASQNIVSLGSSSGDTDWEGKEPKREFIINQLSGDKDLFDLLGLQLVAGEGFFNTPADSGRYILNETAIKRMGIKDPIGKRFSFHERKGIIAGIVKDFHFASMHQKIEPVIFFYNPNWWQIGCVKTTSQDASKTIAAVEKIWKQYNPNFEFKYTFMDEEFDQLYKTEQRISTLFNIFAGIAIFISCLGLFGLATYTAETKIKEIGIRKVLGASVTHIVAMLSKDFIQLVVLAFVIASPLAWYIMNQWLQDFAYRIDIQWWVFIVAGVLALAIALFTVSFQAIKAALANPVKSLRSE